MRTRTTVGTSVPTPDHGVRVHPSQIHPDWYSWVSDYITDALVHHLEHQDQDQDQDQDPLLVTLLYNIHATPRPTTYHDTVVLAETTLTELILVHLPQTLTLPSHANRHNGQPPLRPTPHDTLGRLQAWELSLATCPSITLDIADVITLAQRLYNDNAGTQAIYEQVARRYSWDESHHRSPQRHLLLQEIHNHNATSDELRLAAELLSGNCYGPPEPPSGRRGHLTSATTTALAAAIDTARRVLT